MFLGTSWKENSYLNIVLWLEEPMGVQWITQIRVQAYGPATSMGFVGVHHKKLAAWALAHWDVIG
jgi:hypothetical protein